MIGGGSTSIMAWIGIIIYSVIILFGYFFSALLSYFAVISLVEYLGLPKNYILLTILSIVISPIIYILVNLFIDGRIPALFDPRFL